MAELAESNHRIWIRTTAVLALASMVAVALRDGWPAVGEDDLEAFTEWFEPYRGAWYGMPAVVIAFVLLGLGMVPTLLLVLATGLAFGPLLGPLYAMAGCLASASVGFLLGRLIGLGPVTRLGGQRVTRVLRSLERNGTLAVFLLRKVPAPFLIVNVVAGASNVRYRDFVIGTVLGMGALVVGLAGFGYQVTSALNDPSPRAVLGAALFVGMPLAVAWLVNRALQRPEPHA